MPTRRRGLPVTTAARTIVDLLRTRADGGHIGGVTVAAVRRGLVTVAELAARIAPFARAYGLSGTDSGVNLVEQLVEQGEGRLHARELERAEQTGFNLAVAALAPHLARMLWPTQTLPPLTTSHAMRELTRLRSGPEALRTFGFHPDRNELSPAWQRALAEVIRLRNQSPPPPGRNRRP